MNNFVLFDKYIFDKNEYETYANKEIYDTFDSLKICLTLSGYKIITRIYKYTDKKIQAYFKIFLDTEPKYDLRFIFKKIDLCYILDELEVTLYKPSILEVKHYFRYDDIVNKIKYINNIL